ncbi:hypothetical protein [Luteimonas sp. 100069]|uniref:hypothetical protein n=1 Tax=Luteimonas sp. 100069 TaxID=2006109 RepID=UPI000F4F7639|nr:hypothetical protein [Luteimonas sp. 100069]RPD83687.1 hypothetical protein EGK76_14825 [Luteimonas sp. 100069]
MGISSGRQLRKRARKEPHEFFVIHYSCQSLYDDNRESMSPRITSIIVSHLGSGQSLSFSTHAIAEELGISREEVRGNFDAVERQLLRSFFQFIANNRQKYWVHWNMRNLTFGFEHLEHRYRVLTNATPPEIPVDRRVNLNDIFAEHFGDGYAAHPRLRSLMELNGGVHRDFLGGEEEVLAFEQNEFLRMHNSTHAKTGFISKAFNRFIRGKLVTANRELGVWLDRTFESRLTRGVALFGALASIPLGIYQAYLWWWK